MFYGVAGLLGGLITLGCMVGYLPPYSWIADAQLRLMHTNLVAISLLLTFLLTSLPFVLAARVLEPRLDPDGRLAARWARWDVFFDTWPGKLVLGGMTLAVMGAYLGYRDSSRGPLVELSTRSIERHGAPQAAYVSLTGAQLIAQGSIDFHNGSSTEVYVPVCSGRECPRAAVFARYRRGIPRDAPLTGTLDQDGLPGEIRSAYEEADAIATPHWLLDVGADPYERASVNRWFFASGCALVLIAFVWAFGVRRDEPAS